MLFNTSLKAVIIGKGSFHINKDNITSKIFNKIMKITLSKKKLGEIGINTDINGTIFIEGNIINKNILNKVNYYINTNYNVNNSNNI